MKLKLKVGGHGQAILFKCRAFTIRVDWHKLKDWKRHKQRR